MTDQLRSSLLALHKTLVDRTKLMYEATHGPVAGPAALFRLVVEEPSFQWLRPLSETIVAIDEALETEPPASHEAIVAMVKLRLFPDTPTPFSTELAKAQKADLNITKLVDSLKI
jgi:hypothetical protein